MVGYDGDSRSSIVGQMISSAGLNRPTEIPNAGIYSPDGKRLAEADVTAYRGRFSARVFGRTQELREFDPKPVEEEAPYAFQIVPNGPVLPRRRTDSPYFS